jgi:DNA-binding beta-propeller fold protein YncE
VRLLFLRAVCAVAEGADVPLSLAASHASARCSPEVCVAAVLGDALRRVSVLGGREGMPRSLGSVYGGSVTRFLGGGLRGDESDVVAMPGLKPGSGGVAVSRDGATLLVADAAGGSHAIHVYNIADGLRRRVVGGAGDGPLQFSNPLQVWVAADDFVFVADAGNSRIQVLTPDLDFHGFVGAGELGNPTGVCANSDVVVVSETRPDRMSVFNRHDGALLRRIGSTGFGDGELNIPRALCFLSYDSHVAVADWGNARVSMFSLEGEFVRHVGRGVLKFAHSVACSAFDELVVADGNRMRLFSASGDLVRTLGEERRPEVPSPHNGVIYTQVMGVAIHGGSIFAADRIKRRHPTGMDDVGFFSDSKCVRFT